MKFNKTLIATSLALTLAACNVGVEQISGDPIGNPEVGTVSTDQAIVLAKELVNDVRLFGNLFDVETVDGQVVNTNLADYQLTLDNSSAFIDEAGPEMTLLAEVSDLVSQIANDYDEGLLTTAQEAALTSTGMDFADRITIVGDKTATLVLDSDTFTYAVNVTVNDIVMALAINTSTGVNTEHVISIAGDIESNTGKFTLSDTSKLTITTQTATDTQQYLDDVVSDIEWYNGTLVSAEIVYTSDPSGEPQGSITTDADGTITYQAANGFIGWEEILITYQDSNDVAHEIYHDVDITADNQDEVITIAKLLDVEVTAFDFALAVTAAQKVTADEPSPSSFTGMLSARVVLLTNQFPTLEYDEDDVDPAHDYLVVYEDMYLPSRIEFDGEFATEGSNSFHANLTVNGENIADYQPPAPTLDGTIIDDIIIVDVQSDTYAEVTFSDDFSLGHNFYYTSDYNWTRDHVGINDDEYKGVHFINEVSTLDVNNDGLEDVQDLRYTVEANGEVSFAWTVYSVARDDDSDGTIDQYDMYYVTSDDMAITPAEFVLLNDSDDSAIFDQAGDSDWTETRPWVMWLGSYPDLYDNQPTNVAEWVGAIRLQRYVDNPDDYEYREGLGMIDPIITQDAIDNLSLGVTRFAGTLVEPEYHWEDIDNYVDFDAALTLNAVVGGYDTDIVLSADRAGLNAADLQLDVRYSTPSMDDGRFSIVYNAIDLDEGESEQSVVISNPKHVEIQYRDTRSDVEKDSGEEYVLGTITVSGEQVAEILDRDGNIIMAYNDGTLESF